MIAIGMGDERSLNEATVSKEITFSQLLPDDDGEYSPEDETDYQQISITAIG